MKQAVKLISVILCLALLLCGCQSASDSPPPQEPNRHSYTLADLTLQSDGRMAYTNSYETGIDVSVHQGKIDWAKVAADGIDFAIIRVGYRGRETGLLNLDKNFKTNIEGALQNGIKVGVYFYSQATTKAEAEEEATFVLKQILPYKLSYPVVYDLEIDTAPDARANALTGEERTLFATAFCNIVQLAGYTPMVYGSASFLNSGFDLMSIQRFSVWVAHYTDNLTFPWQFAMWQYTKNGRVDGISKQVDLNICLTPYY